MKPLSNIMRLFNFVILLSASAALALINSGCNGKVDVASLTLELAPDSAAGVTVPADFNTDVYTVLRCSELSAGLHAINIKTSKSMKIAASYLIFMDMASFDAGQESILVAVAPVTGKEYEYDVETARWYLVTRQTAEEAATLYGIAYADWEYGAISGSEKFPCCE